VSVDRWHQCCFSSKKEAAESDGRRTVNSNPIRFASAFTSSSVSSIDEASRSFSKCHSVGPARKETWLRKCQFRKQGGGGTGLTAVDPESAGLEETVYSLCAGGSVSTEPPHNSRLEEEGDEGDNTKTHRQIIHNIPRRINKEARHTSVPPSQLLLTLIQLQKVSRRETEVRFSVRDQVGPDVGDVGRAEKFGGGTGVGEGVEVGVEGEGVGLEGGVEEEGGGDEL